MYRPTCPITRVLTNSQSPEMVNSSHSRRTRRPGEGQKCALRVRVQFVALGIGLSNLPFSDSLDSDCLHETDQWGSYFYTTDKKLSYWGYALKRFATIYVPCVSRWSLFPVDQRVTVNPNPSPNIALISVPLDAHDTPTPTNWLIPSREGLEQAANVVHKLAQEARPTNVEEAKKLVVERS